MAARPANRRRLPSTAWLRVVHPFPSSLDAVVTGVVAALAGAQPGRVALLAASMLLLQFSIGTANDVADRGADAAAGRTTKPLATGLLSVRQATGAAIALGALGLGGAAIAGPLALVVAACGFGLGIAYDVALKRTAWSWLPFALGIPLLPAFAAIGATGGVPAPLLVLVALAVPAGAALAVSNALGDVEADAVAGIETVATRLGATRAMRLVIALDLLVVAVAALLALGAGAGRGTWLVALGGAVVLAGAGLTRRVRGARGWEVQAVGFAIIATGWVLGQADAGLLG